LAAARKAFGTTITFAIIPRQCEKSGLALIGLLEGESEEADTFCPQS